MRKRKKRAERRRIRRLKIKTLLMLSITLIFNTYAWFLYITTVSTNMTVHVDAWSVNFEVDDEIIEKQLLFNIEHAYPRYGRSFKTSKNNKCWRKIGKINT